MLARLAALIAASALVLSGCAGDPDPGGSDPADGGAAGDGGADGGGAADSGAADSGAADGGAGDPVETQLLATRSAVEQALAENPDLKPGQVSRELLEPYGFTESRDVTVVVAVRDGDYCLYALPTKYDGEYGMEVDEVLFTDSTSEETRTVAVSDGAFVEFPPGGVCEGLNRWQDL